MIRSMLHSILHLIKVKAKFLLLLAFVLPLCACEDICPTIQDYLTEGIGAKEDGSDCLLCGIFDVLIDTSKKIATHAWSALAKALIPIVGLVAAIYIAIYTLKLVGSFGKQTATDYLSSDKNGLFVLMFKTAIIVFLLSGAAGDGNLDIFMGGLGDLLGIGNASNKNFLIQQIISPLLTSGLEIGQALAIKSGNGFSFDFYSTNSMLPALDAAFRSPWGAVFEMIRKAVYGFNAATYEPIAVGQAMICNSLDDSYNPLSWYYLMLIYGFILFIFGWLLMLGIGFYIVDIIIDLMFAAVLLPIGVACAISPKTSSYTQKIWGIFVNIFFYFIMLGIVLGITMRAIDLSLGRAILEVNDAESAIAATGGALANFLTDYQYKFDSNEIKSLSEDLWNNGNLLFTIICLSVITMLISQTKNLASKISGGTSLSGAGAKVSAEVSRHAMYGAEKIGKEAYGRVLKPGAENTGKSFVRMTRLDHVYNWTRGKAAVVRGFSTGGGSQGYRSVWDRQNARTYWRNTRSAVRRAWTHVRGWF
ncbi:MAG: hypothetical protein NC218_05720 [Acetobacter sp.]|nr:hypothetical protein [Acetobacter sp.]